MRGLSLVAASGGHSSSRCTGLSLSRPLLLRSTGSRRAGSVIVAHGQIVAPRQVGSSQTRVRTRVPCIGRQTLNHCATREALLSTFLVDYGRRGHLVTVTPLDLEVKVTAITFYLKYCNSAQISIPPTFLPHVLPFSSHMRLQPKPSFLLSIKYTKHLSVLGPLHLFFLLPRILFSFKLQLKCHLP